MLLTPGNGTISKEAAPYRRMEECELLHIESLFLVVRKWGFISQTEVDMPTVKQSIGIATAIVMAFVAATAFGISALEQSPPPLYGFKGSFGAQRSSAAQNASGH